MTAAEPRDERIDPLTAAAVLTDTQIRMAFAPENTSKRITALKQDLRQNAIDLLAVNCSRGSVHIQIKAGFGRERHMELTLPELLLVRELADKFIMELAMASDAPAFDAD